MTQETGEHYTAAYPFIEHTPTNPWVAAAGGESYYTEALRRIEQTVDRTDVSWLNYPADQIHDLLLHAARAEHTDRCTKAAMSHDHLHAAVGSEHHTVSTTEEAFRLLAGTRQLVSLELGNILHPLHWMAAARLDGKIRDCAENFASHPGHTAAIDETGMPGTSAIKLPHTHGTTLPDFMVVYRERDYAKLQADDDRITIRKRAGLLIDVRSDIPQEFSDVHSILVKNLRSIKRLDCMFSDGKIKKEEYAVRRSEAVADTGRYLDHAMLLQLNDRPSWLQPVTTAYYGFRPSLPTD